MPTMNLRIQVIIFGCIFFLSMELSVFYMSDLFCSPLQILFLMLVGLGVVMFLFLILGACQFCKRT